MEADARRTLAREGAAPADVSIERSMDIHYYGQVREQNAAVPDGPVTAETLAVTVDRFHDKHRRVIGYSEPGYPTVIVRLHLAGVAKIVPPPPRRDPAGDRRPCGGAQRSAGPPTSRRPAASPRCRSTTARSSARATSSAGPASSRSG